jgi:hypothetical protein
VPLNLHESFPEKRKSWIFRNQVRSIARGEDGFDLIYFLLSFACAYRHFDACFEVAVSRLKLMHSRSQLCQTDLYCAW